MRRALPLALCLAAAATLAACGGGEPERRAPEGVPATFFGVAPQDAVSDVDLARMSAGRVGSYHLLLSWAQIEGRPGVYNWDSYDRLLGKLARFGIEPVPYVFGTPAYLAEVGNVPPTESGKALVAWEAFLGAAAERYGPGGEFWQGFAETSPGIEPRPLRIWEIWNEVNGPAFWSPEPSPADYATLLKRSERALHAIDPEAQIMVAGMFATPSKPGAINSAEFLRELFEQRKATEAVDLVAVHPYGPRLENLEQQIAETYAEMERAGLGDAGVWITEFGWGSNASISNQLTKTPRRQAELLRETYEMLIERRQVWNIQGGLWYTWRDPVNPVGLCAWCASAGLVDNDLDPKPAWLEFTGLTGGEARP